VKPASPFLFVNVMTRVKKIVEKFYKNDKTSYFLLLENIVNNTIIINVNFWKGRRSMESKFYEKDKLLVLKITSEVDDHNVQEIRRKADYEMERYMPKKVIFDFDGVTFMDSSGIGLVIGRYKFANMIGAKLGVSNLTGSVRRIFDMSGILKLIPTIELN